MVITRSGIVALVALCGAAGAGGAYLATRTNLEPATATVAAAPQETPAVATDRSEASVSAPSSTSTSLAAPAPRKTLRTAERTHPPTAVATAPSTSAASAAPVEQVATVTPEPEPAQPSATTPVVSEPEFEELVVDSDVVLGLQVENTISSETARVEDQVIAHVTRDLRVGDRIAIPSGSKVYGEVTMVERGGRVRERARLGVRFTSLLMPDGSRLPISTDAVFRDGDAPSRESAAKIGGGALGGAIIGGILGGGKGAIIGSTVGAGAGTATVMAGGRNAATLAAGTLLTVRLTRPLTITVDR